MTDFITSGTWDLGEPEQHRLSAAMNAIIGTHILDLGSRDGTFALTLAKEHPEMTVHGIDTDASSVAWGNAKADELGIDNVTFFVYDILKEDAFAALGEHSYNTVLLMETLEHLDPKDIQRADDNARRFIKKGGRLIVTVPANSHISDPNHRRIFYREDIIRMPGVVWLKDCPHLWIGFTVDV